MKTTFTRILLAFLLPFLAVAQQQSYIKFGSEQGLTQNYIYSLTQDAQGYLWIATAEGAFKYNGFNFTELTTKQSLSENFVNTTYTDVKGNVWLGHYKGAVTKISAEGIVNVDVPKSKSRINQILEDSKGRVLAVSQNFGIIQLNSLVGTTFVFPNAQTYTLTQTAKGFYLGASNGLHKVSVQKGRVSVLKTLEFFQNKIIKNIIAQNNLLYVGTEDNGLYVVDVTTNKVIGLQTAIPANKIQGFYKDKNQNIWVATNKGFAKISPQKQIRFYDENSGIETPNTKSIFEDNEGNIWIGTYGGGLYKLQNSFINVYTTSKGLLSNNVQSVFVDSDSSIWAGSAWGITHLIPTTTEYEGGYTQTKFKAELRNTTTAIKSIFKSKNSDLLWVGTAKKGVYRMDPVTKRFFSFKYQNKFESRIINNFVEDSKGNIWIATTGGGAYKFNSETKEIKLYTTREGLPHNDVNQIYEDSKSNIWLLTYGHGISKIQPNGKLTVYRTKDGLGTHEITTITEDKNANIWFGTLGDGIFKYDSKTFTNYSTENGLASNYCYTLNSDKKGNIFIGSKKGITKFNTTNNTAIIYNPSGYNVTNYDVNVNASVFANGKLLFGTRNGLLEYNSLENIENIVKPNVVINSVWINNKKQNNVDEIDLSYKRWNLKFNYEGITFKDPENLSYSYILDGYDTHWSEPTTDIEAVYNKVDYGNYTFKVKACNANGTCSKIVSSKTITIAAPIWTKWWFYLIMFILLALIVILIIRVREKQHREARNILEEAVVDRTKQLNQKNEELAETNHILEHQKGQLENLNKEIESYAGELESKNQDLDQFSHIVSHDLKAPVNGIGMLAQVIEAELATSENDNVKQSVTMLQDRVQTMVGLIDAILKYSKAGKESIEKEKVDINDLLKGIKEDTNPPENIDVNFQTDFPIITTEKIHLYQIFANLISNAVKYNDKEEGRVYVSHSLKNEKYYQFSVSDNGKGIPSDSLHKVFQMFETINETDSYKSTGIGLAIVKKIIEEKGGKIWVDSEQGKGSTFSFTWPVK